MRRTRRTTMAASLMTPPRGRARATTRGSPPASGARPGGRRGGGSLPQPAAHEQVAHGADAAEGDRAEEVGGDAVGGHHLGTVTVQHFGHRRGPIGPRGCQVCSHRGHCRGGISNERTPPGATRWTFSWQTLHNNSRFSISLYRSGSAPRQALWCTLPLLPIRSPQPAQHPRAR